GEYDRVAAGAARVLGARYRARGRHHAVEQREPDRGATEAAQHGSASETKTLHGRGSFRRAKLGSSTSASTSSGKRCPLVRNFSTRASTNGCSCAASFRPSAKVRYWRTAHASRRPELTSSSPSSAGPEKEPSPGRAPVPWIVQLGMPSSCVRKRPATSNCSRPKPIGSIWS